MISPSEPTSWAPALPLRRPGGILPLSLSAAPDLSPIEDGALARLASGGPRERVRAAEEELCKRFAPRIRLYGLRHLRTEHAAQDLVQRVLLVLVAKLRNDEVKEPDRIASFVLGTARRISLEMLRGAHRETPLDDSELQVAAAPSFEPLARQRLREGLDVLSERERTVLLLSFYQEQTSKEIATALGMTEGNVRVLRHRAVGRLREFFAEASEEGTS